MKELAKRYVAKLFVVGCLVAALSGLWGVLLAGLIAWGTPAWAAHVAVWATFTVLLAAVAEVVKE